MHALSVTLRSRSDMMHAFIPSIYCPFWSGTDIAVCLLGGSPVPIVPLVRSG
jgi:hypothetical protein